MRNLFIGIQGAAKMATLAAADNDGQIIKHVAVGPLAIKVNTDFQQSLERACKQLAEALSFASIADLADRTKALCISMSGVFLGTDHDVVLRSLREASFSVDPAPVICEDVWGSLAAEGIDSGAVVMASTGANVFVRNAEGAFVTVGGWGSDIGDFGSGYYIGKQAIIQVLEAVDERRNVSRQFIDLILESLRLSDPVQLVSWYHEVRKTSFWRLKIADLAALVVRLAEDPDAPDRTALEIVTESCCQLGISVRAAFNRACQRGLLAGAKGAWPVVLAGGLGCTSELYESTVRATLNSLSSDSQRKALKWPDFDLRVASIHPIVGALGFAISGTTRVPSRRVWENICSTAPPLSRIGSNEMS